MPDLPASMNAEARDRMRQTLSRIARLDDQPPPQARGCDHRGQKRLVLDIDPETFDQIRAYGIRERVSVSAAVRELVEFGLEASSQEAR